MSRNAPCRKRRKKRIYADHRIFIDSLKIGKACELCSGKFNPWQMHFDHLDRSRKKYDLSALIGRSGFYRKFDEEFPNLRLLCANCHADETYKNKHWRPVQRQDNESSQIRLPLLDVI